METGRNNSEVHLDSSGLNLLSSQTYQKTARRTKHLAGISRTSSLNPPRTKTVSAELAIKTPV
eukprot:10469417-Heterocapsa_arctica.AAC.1